MVNVKKNKNEIFNCNSIIKFQIKMETSLVVREDIIKKNDSDIIINPLKIELPIYQDYQYEFFRGAVDLAINNDSDLIDPLLKNIGTSSRPILFILKQFGLENICDIIILNLYKLEVLSRLSKLECRFQCHELLFELVMKSPGNTHLDAIDVFSRTISEIDILTLFDIMKTNFLLYTGVDCVLYYKNDITTPVVVFKYINNKDIEFKGIFPTLNDVYPQARVCRYKKLLL